MEEEFAVYSPFELDSEVSHSRMVDYATDQVENHLSNGDLTWIIDHSTGESQSLSEIIPASRSVASWFYKRGMRKGDTLIYMTSHLARLHTVFLGVWKANGILRATYPEDDADTLALRVEESRAGWILCDSALAELCSSVAQKFYWGVEVIVIGNTEVEGCVSFTELFEDEADEVPECIVAKEDPCLVLCTSGTTGNSKGAVYSQEAFLHTVIAFQCLPWNHGGPFVAVSKGTHITGCMIPFAQMCQGRPLVVISKLSKQALFEAVDKHKPKALWSFPTFIMMMVLDPTAAGYDFSSIEFVATGGAPTTPEMERIMLQLPNVKSVVKVYGLTEIAPITSTFNHNFTGLDDLQLPDVPDFSIGKPSPGAVIQFRDSETNEIIAEPNRPGEICAKASWVFSNYMNNQEATEASFINGYFRTGDLGYFDLDGYIYLVDRIKEVFKYWNNHISPTEIEDVINKHEAIGKVCVFGVPDPDGGGFIPRAFAVPVIDNYDVEEIIEFTNARLASYKHLRGGLYMVDELPQGKTGKVQRNLLAQLPLPEHQEGLNNNSDVGEETTEANEETPEGQLEVNEDSAPAEGEEAEADRNGENDVPAEEE